MIIVLTFKKSNNNDDLIYLVKIIKKRKKNWQLAQLEEVYIIINNNSNNNNKNKNNKNNLRRITGIEFNWNNSRCSSSFLQPNNKPYIRATIPIPPSLAVVPLLRLRFCRRCQIQLVVEGFPIWLRLLLLVNLLISAEASPSPCHLLFLFKSLEANSFVQWNKSREL